MSVDKDIESIDQSTNVVWHQSSVSHKQRVERNEHAPAVLWFTGLSGSGKSTIANAVDNMLYKLGCQTYLLDGDNIRHGLNGDLGFTQDDRVENIRRIGEVAKLFVDAGMLVSTAFISPFENDRNMVRRRLKDKQFIEVFIDTPLSVCEQRDPKGLYKQARDGEIKNFTGIDSDYEVPVAAEIHIKTVDQSVEAAALQVVAYLKQHGYLVEKPLTTHFKQQWLRQMVTIAKVAGDAILSVYHVNDNNFTTKADSTPVTAADFASNDVIISQLAKLTPNIPILSEEGDDIGWHQRRNWTCYWLIDPLDGTKEFINRNGEFTVNIAFIERGKTVAGVVYAPVLDKCYFGGVDIGAWVDDGDRCCDLNKLPPQVTDIPRLVGSRSHLSADLDRYRQSLGCHEMTSIGSSLKFCLLAEGKAELYPRLGLTSEWDTAAAQAVLEGAGGKVINYETGETLSYNQKENILNPWFIATARDYCNKPLKK